MLKEFKNDLVDFCSTTSIQGMRNVTDSNQGCVSRAIWTIVIIASFVFSGICIKESIDGMCIIIILSNNEQRKVRFSIGINQGRLD
jgi:hypothetical protein